ncbi:class I SAM-dependent methyltransferase [Helicobacter japonicus]|uniref:class I SAM-dependent methyltransferase n=1 Tax=Helicobacter japonicus TaxID=425400 RepID=UPI0026293805|nr:class I SAM-dependent methyltransferase [Helicobacter japonicus]
MISKPQAYEQTRFIPFLTFLNPKILWLLAGGGGYDTNSQTSKNCHLPFENESFEVVTLLAVLEHLNYPLDMLREIARVLKPNGILLLTVPSHLAKPVLEFLAYKLKIVSEDEIRDHKTYYNKKDLTNLIQQTPNLCLHKHNYFQLGMNNFAIIRKIL